MFGSHIPEAVYKDNVEPEPKKKKLDGTCDIQSIHSSLKYSSIKAPPLVAYKSIDSYCENKRWESVPNIPSTSGFNDVKSVSSPIVFKTPKSEPSKKALTEEAMPHILFSIEELSLVNSLKNWTSTKVCAIGQVSFDNRTQTHYLNSACEVGQWTVLLDVSLLEENPKLQQLIQVYGTLEMSDAQPCVKVFFIKNLSWVNLSLFKESYSLMKMQVGMIECVNKYDVNNQIESVKNPNKIIEAQMNDTLDDFSFSSLA